MSRSTEKIECPECKRQYNVTPTLFGLEETITLLLKHRFMFPFCVCGHKRECKE